MNKNLIKIGASFIFGVAFGGGITYIWRKKDEERRIEEQICKIREKLSNKNPKIDDESSNDSENSDEIRKNDAKNKAEMNNIIKNNGYVNEFDTPMSNTQQKIVNMIMGNSSPEEKIKPFIPSEEELAEDLSYKSVDQFLTLYLGDQVLADTTTLEHVDFLDTIGEDLYYRFLKSNTDDIFVKNPNNDMLYEVTKEDGKYSEMMELYHGGE